MNKILLIIAIFILLSCEKKEEPIIQELNYTEKQQEAFSVLKGTWIGSYGLTSNYKITFGAQYEYGKRPTFNVRNFADDILGSGGKPFSPHGELEYNHSGTSENYYYQLSLNADKLTLVHKGGNRDKYEKETFSLRVNNETEFRLFTEDLLLPYIYVKQ